MSVRLRWLLISTLLGCMACGGQAPQRHAGQVASASVASSPQPIPVELPALVANELGREPVKYLRNIFKYYTAYRLLAEQDEIRQRLRPENPAGD